MKSTDVLKYLEGNCSEQEKRRMADWLDASPEHVREFNEIRFVFETTKMYGPELERLAAGETPQRATTAAASSRPTVMRMVFRRVLRVAAVVALLLGVGYSTYVYTFDSVSEQMVALNVPAGQRIEVTLSDGTSVWLNSGSRLEYPSVFGRHRREVKLTGEAMFEVTHDAGHPFVVETFASDVEVLGTKFNVEADAETGSFSTTLLEGRVRLTDPATHRAIVLEPNDEARLTEGRISVERNADLDAVCWTEGLISIRGLSFEELMRKFEKAYNVRIDIRRREMPVIGFKSGKIRISDGVDHALRVLQHNSDFRFEHDVRSNVITIY